MWIRGAHAGTATASPQSTEGSGLVCMGAGAGAWGVGTVAAFGGLGAGDAAAPAGVESNASSPQLGNTVAFGVAGGSAGSSLYIDDGGQAGMVCSVGGSGGQMSVSSGIAPGAGAASSVGGRFPRPAPGDRPAGGHVGLAGGTRASRASASLIVSPGGPGPGSAPRRG